MKKPLLACTAVAAVLAMAQQADAQDAAPPALLALQPSAQPEVAPFVIDPAADPNPSAAEMAALLRAKVKYVFVIFNENHSFDNEYGTFPGVNGLYSDGSKPRSTENTPGFTQSYADANGATVSVKPFLIGP